MDLTVLNAAKESLIAKSALAGIMPVDIQKYYIPYDEILAIFTEVSSLFSELSVKIDDLDIKIDDLDKKIDALEARVEILEG